MSSYATYFQSSKVESNAEQKLIILSAFIKAGDLWMRANYGDIRVEFASNDIEGLLEIKRRATEAGLTVVSAW